MLASCNGIHTHDWAEALPGATTTGVQRLSSVVSAARGEKTEGLLVWLGASTRAALSRSAVIPRLSWSVHCSKCWLTIRCRLTTPAGYLQSSLPGRRTSKTESMTM